MTPYYQHAGITIYHGDCQEILPQLPPADLIFTSPPYNPGGAPWPHLDQWKKHLDTDGSVPHEKVILQWLNYFSPPEILIGIRNSAPAINGRPWTFPRFENYIRYVSGVMKNRREKESA